MLMASKFFILSLIIPPLLFFNGGFFLWFGWGILE